MSDKIQELPNIPALNLNGVDTELRHLDERADELQQLRNVMIEKGGVNRDLVLAMESLEEGVISTICPINGFTKDFSLTNATIAMEAAKFSIKDTLIKMFQLFVKMMRRLFEWVFGKQGENEKRVSNIRVYVKRTRFINTEVAKVLEKGVVDTGPRFLLNDTLNLLAKGANEVTRDVLAAGPFHTALVSLGDSLPTIVKVLELKVDMLVAAAKMSGKNATTSDTLAILSQLVEVRKPIPVDYLNNTVSRSGVKGSFATLTDMMDLLNVHQQQMLGTSVSLTRDDILDSILDAKHDVAETYLKNSDKTMDRLTNLMANLATLERVSVNGGINPEVVDSLRSALMAVEGELNAIATYITVIVNMCIELHTLTSAVSGAQEGYMKAILKMALMSDDKATVETAQKIVGKLRGKL